PGQLVVPVAEFRGLDGAGRGEGLGIEEDHGRAPEEERVQRGGAHREVGRRLPGLQHARPYPSCDARGKRARGGGTKMPPTFKERPWRVRSSSAAAARCRPSRSPTPCWP